MKGQAVGRICRGNDMQGESLADGIRNEGEQGKVMGLAGIGIGSL